MLPAFPGKDHCFLACTALMDHEQIGKTISKSQKWKKSLNILALPGTTTDKMQKYGTLTFRSAAETRKTTSAPLQEVMGSKGES